MHSPWSQSRTVWRNGRGVTILGLVLSLLLLPLLSARGAAAQSDVSLNFSRKYEIDQSAIRGRDRTKPFYFALKPSDTSLNLPFFPFTADVGTEFGVSLNDAVPSNSPVGGRSLAIRITADHDEDKKDKIFLAIAPHNSPLHMVEDGASNRVRLSFDLMFDKDYQVPSAWLMHLQAWQCCGGHPIFAMGVQSGSDPKGQINLGAGLRDDRLESAPQSPQHELFSKQILRSRWYHFDLELEPQSDKSSHPGYAAMWIDGVRCFAYTGPWGYDPAQLTAHGHSVQSDIGLEIGTYRRRQATTQTISLANVTYSRVK